MWRTPLSYRRSKRIADRQGVAMPDQNDLNKQNEGVSAAQPAPATVCKNETTNVNEHLLQLIKSLQQQVLQLQTAQAQRTERSNAGNNVATSAEVVISDSQGSLINIDGLTTTASKPIVPVSAVQPGPMSSTFSSTNLWTNSTAQLPMMAVDRTYGAAASAAPAVIDHNMNLQPQRTGTMPRQLQDLPEFSGRPEEWPMFAAAFEYSSAMYNYSDYENSQRLHKCLRGEAKEAVSALLIYPNNVGSVMEQLKFRFGRPDQLIASQLTAVRAIAPITEHNIERVVQFASKVKNLAIFLSSLNSQHHISNPTLLEELVNKLPMSKRMDWAKVAMFKQPYPTLMHFSEWIEELAKVVCVAQGVKSTANVEAKRRVVLHAVDESAATRGNCSICTGGHTIDSCKQFQAEPVSDRWAWCRKLGLCFGCLSLGHTTRNCKVSKRCSLNGCNKKHHRLLHWNADKPKQAASREAAIDNENKPAVLSCRNAPAKKKHSVLFRVLPIVLYGPKKQLKTYALLDEGSSISMVDSTLLAELGVKGHRRYLNVSWFGGKSSRQSTSVVDLEISAVESDTKYRMHHVYAVKNIDLPAQSLSVEDIQHDWNNIPLTPYSNVKPLVLIGLDHSALSVAAKTIEVKPGGPFMAETKLGWVIFGPTLTKVAATASCLTIHQSDDHLHDLVTQYFNDENIGVKAAPLMESGDDKRARNILKVMTKKVGDRFQSGLLWKDDTMQLPESYPMAEKRLISLERKLKKDGEFATKYAGIIQDYVNKGYARKLTPNEALQTNAKTWYLPHFAVMNANKPGKVRMVFDAAAKVSGTSLNTCLLKGPQEYKPLPEVLFNFRRGAIAICADIREMFHQVVIHPDDRAAQRFLWRDNDDTRPPDTYEMRVMTFGAACSPCIAQYVKTVNALQHTQHDPRAIEAILDHHYVDDFVDSFATEAEAVKISRQVVAIHKDAGFELRGFASNSAAVVRELGTGENMKLLVAKNEDGIVTEKVLGMYWEPGNDVFRYKLKFHRINGDIIDYKRLPTKRELLSIVMSVFDPLGFLSHLLIAAKLLMREVWRTNVGWDETIPDGLGRAWQLWLGNLKGTERLGIPRRYFPKGSPKRVELHIFVDASEDACAAVAYWRNAADPTEVAFISAKTKCAPLKTLSIPRLELQSAVMGSRLKTTILSSNTFDVVRCTLWSDSKTVLRWIKSPARRFKPFVSHRIAEILTNTAADEWKWLPTEYNFADEATRMQKKLDLTYESRWFTGPTELFENNYQQPNTDIDEDDNNEILGPKFVLTTAEFTLIDWQRFSSYSILVRSMAWVLRFSRRSRKQRCASEVHGLTAGELDEAETKLLQQVQRESYEVQIKTLRANKALTKGDCLLSLLPYLDEKHVLRVGGRLSAASWLPVESMHPVILPPEHEMTALIIERYHQKGHHQNNELLICEIRRRYWVPRLRQIVRKVITNCLVCKILKSSAVPPVMGQLPRDRVTPYVRPFSFTGLDYFGPITVAIGRRAEKRWVALFTCLTVRAIHLEIAKDLSTDACILVIRNFMNRRGIPERMRTDNGKNFVGLANDPRSFSETFECEQIQNELSAKGVEWVFNCPCNPSEGGIWERMVRSVKRVLQQTLKETTPQEHTLNTLLIEAENIINSRPLTHIPISAEDEEPLTPNHFLIGYNNASRIQINEESLRAPDSLRKQWRIVRQLKNQFWKRWILEYLPTLTRRTKWCRYNEQLKINDLVFVCDENLPRQQWCRGKVVKVYHGKDGIVRRADILTKSGVIRRAASRLAVLNVE